MTHNNPPTPEGGSLPTSGHSTDSPARNPNEGGGKPESQTPAGYWEVEARSEAVTLPDGGVLDGPPQAYEPLLPPPIPSRQTAAGGAEEHPRRRGYGNTIALALGGTAAEALVHLALHKRGVETGNAGSRHGMPSIIQRPVKNMFRLVVQMPLVEELLTRAIPSAIVDKVAPHKKGTTAWGAGIVSSVGFALIHGTRDAENNRVYPMQQLAGGLMYWYLHRKRGFDHAVVAHAAVNSLSGLTALTAVALAKREHIRRGGSADTFDAQAYLEEIFDS